MSENNINENPGERIQNLKDEVIIKEFSEQENSVNTDAEAETPKEISNSGAVSGSELPENGEPDNEIGEEVHESRFQEYFNEEVEKNNPKMTNTLLTLHELRSIDEELTEIEDEKGDLPDKIEFIKEEIKSLSKELNEKKQSLSKLEEEKTKLIADNNSYEERINKYDEQKFDVRSNKEYDEIVKTIESLFEEVGKNEKRIKDIEEIYTMLGTDVQTLEGKTEEINAELKEKQTLLDELDEQYKQDESGLREKRDELLKKIDPSSSLLYERINKSFKGEATAIVRKGNCSGCYNSIPPQTVIEIKSAEKLYTCQSCGRILIAEELLAGKE
jgi:predicted  nucleic acid-binding Zn-ribbon protein